MENNAARSAATAAILMRFTWTFLVTVTIDLIAAAARDVPAPPPHFVDDVEKRGQAPFFNIFDFLRS